MAFVWVANASDIHCDITDADVGMLPHLVSRVAALHTNPFVQWIERREKSRHEDRRRPGATIPPWLPKRLRRQLRGEGSIRHRLVRDLISLRAAIHGWHRFVGWGNVCRPWRVWI